MANLFLVFLCFQIVLAFNMNGTCKQEVMPLAVRASLFLTVVSHLTLTPLLVKCLPLVNSVPYVIQYNAKCAACTEWVSHFPINNPKMLWFRTWYLYRNLPFSCPEMVYRELGITSDGRPAPDWTNKVKCTLYCPGQGIFFFLTFWQLWQLLHQQTDMRMSCKNAFFNSMEPALKRTCENAQIHLNAHDRCDQSCIS